MSKHGTPPPDVEQVIERHVRVHVGQSVLNFLDDGELIAAVLPFEEIGILAPPPRTRSLRLNSGPEATGPNRSLADPDGAPGEPPGHGGGRIMTRAAYVPRITTTVVTVRATCRVDASARAAWALSRGLSVSGELSVGSVEPLPWVLDDGAAPPPEGSPRLWAVTFSWSGGEVAS